MYIDRGVHKADMIRVKLNEPNQETLKKSIQSIIQKLDYLSHTRGYQTRGHFSLHIFP